MQIHSLTPKEALKAVGIGIVTAILLSAVMVPAFKFGVSPMPKPPSLAFAETLFGRDLPMPVGLLFHVAYVTFWAFVYVVLFRDRLTFLNALWLGLALLGGHPGFLLPGRRLGVPRAGDKSQAHSGVVGAPRSFRAVSVGIVPNGLQEEDVIRSKSPGLKPTTVW